MCGAAYPVLRLGWLARRRRLAPGFGLKPSDVALLEPYRALIRIGERILELAMRSCDVKRCPSGLEKIRRQCRSQLALLARRSKTRSKPLSQLPDLRRSSQILWQQNKTAFNNPS